MRHSEALLPIHPGGRAETVRPASFSQIKALQRSEVRYPAANLQPAKLIATEGIAIPEQTKSKSIRSKVRAAAAAANSQPAGASIPAPPMTAPWQDDPRLTLSGSRTEPLWHALFAPESDIKSKAPEPISKKFDLNESKLRSHSAFDWGSAGDIDVGDLTKTQKTRVKPPAHKPFWLWQSVEGVFLSKTFARSLAAVTILLFASTVDAPWREWLNRQASNIKQPIVTAMDNLSRPIQERAAFQINDEFTTGIDNWASTRSLDVDPAGWLKMQQGLALNTETTNLIDYRMDFDAKIQNRAVGWVVRAPDTDNFYEFKLFQKGTEANPQYSLARYSMLDGVKTLVAEGIEVPSHLAKPDDFNRISMRVMGDNVTTLINGWGVDHWRDGAIKRGGVGLIADAGESALVRKMTVSGNDDTWGLILYGAIESVRSVQDLFGSGQAPAVILFYRPGGIPASAAPTFLLQGPRN
ncbi:MAG: hypothetical protein R2748_27865 [Bryobacterales bacterium]